MSKDIEYKGFTIIEAVESGYMIIYNGYQWGPPGSAADKSGAYGNEYETVKQARNEIDQYLKTWKF